MLTHMSDGLANLCCFQPLMLEAVVQCLGDRIVYEEAEAALRMTLNLLGDNTSSKGNIFERVFVGLLARKALTVGGFVDLFLSEDIQRPRWFDGHIRNRSLELVKCGQAQELGPNDDYEWLAHPRLDEVLFPSTLTGPGLRWFCSPHLNQCTCCMAILSRRDHTVAGQPTVADGHQVLRKERRLDNLRQKLRNNQRW